ncbi:MAG: deoxyribose-phosphate aldolase [Thermodesulfovibrionales bacterium]
MRNIFSRKSLADIIDYSILMPDATYGDIEKVCKEAMQHGFHSVCINPYFVLMAKNLLRESDVKVTTVIGYPLGMNNTDVKVYEAMKASLNGADELDIVINIGALKSGDWRTVRKDIYDVISATREKIHKTIIETCYLDDEEKKKAVEIALEAGSEFIKTSTGFGPRGAMTKDIRLIKEIVRDSAGIKASGGIRTLKDVFEMIEAGATRIGTSSAVKILVELKKRRGN